MSERSLVPTRSIWTQFQDMHSGGRTKVVIDDTEYDQIYIEAPEAEAVEVFRRKWRDPRNVTCDCCGGDYSIKDGPLQLISAYHRNANVDPETFEEKRTTRGDKIILDIVGRQLSRFDKRTQDLYRMAKDKSSPKEAAIAMEKLALSDVGSAGYLWFPKPLIPFDDFLKVPKLANGEWAMLIRRGEW